MELKMFNLFEDEDDIFMGSPKSKFHDIVFNANRNLVELELERLIERQAALELMLGEFHGEELERKIDTFMLENKDDVVEVAKNLYIESMGNVLSQNE
jgi:hypothetical protein